MNLTDEQNLFLSKRRKLVHSWRYVGSALIFITLGILTWQFIRNPLLANPLEVASRLSSNTIPESTLSVMVVMMPVFFLVSYFLILVVILILSFSLSTEKKYQRILDALLSSKNGGN